MSFNQSFANALDDYLLKSGLLYHVQARARIDLEATSLPLPCPLLLPLFTSILYCKGPLVYLFEHRILCLPIFNHLPLPRTTKDQEETSVNLRSKHGFPRLCGSAGIPRPRDWYGKAANGLWVACPFGSIHSSTCGWR